MKSYSRQVVLKTLIRLTSVLVIYGILRLIFYGYNVSHFPDAMASHFINGIRFDISAIIYLNLPFIVAMLLPFDFVYRKAYRILCDIYFVVANSMGFLVQLIDIAYFPYVSKRLTSDIFSYVGSADFDFASLLPVFFKQFTLLFIIFLILIFLLILLCRLCKVKKTEDNKSNSVFYKNICCILLLFLSLIGMRGGFQLKPLSIVSAGNYSTPQYTPLVLNTPFTILRTIGKKTVEEFNYFKDLETAEQYFSPLHSRYEGPNFKTPAVKNVVIIVLEGVSQELFSFYNSDRKNYPVYCPFLDSLAKKSLAFNGIANGRRTMEGIPSIVCGIPSLMEKAYLETPFVMNRIISPVSILSKNGFRTCFFHGGKNGSMNFESFCHSIGYKDYFGMNEYPEPEDFDGYWGIPDKSYLQYMSKVLDTISKPFFATVLTLSSHHPFKLPKDAGNRVYPEGKHPMHKVSAYTDYALSLFFKEISKKKWYDSTLFIITADHAYEGGGKQNQNLYFSYKIPLLFYHPCCDTAFYDNKFVQQTDIMPSLFAYLNLQKPMLCFGQNIFSPKHRPLASNYLSGVYQLFTNNFLLQYNGRDIIAYYDLKNDPELKHNEYKEKNEEAENNLIYLKALLQSYSTRMIHNQLYIQDNE